MGFWSFFKFQRFISAKKARKLVSEGAALVDVRTSEEFAEKCIPGAINIPIVELSRRYQEISVEKPIVVYCQDGQRSQRAIRVLGQVRTVKAYNLGAMRRWTRECQTNDSP